MECPELDDRCYRVINLTNQLKALLISDPNTDKASAALDVDVGNFSDPDDIPGLAHAVEHLLHMGTKKVRQEYYRCTKRPTKTLVSGTKCLQGIPRQACRKSQGVNPVNFYKLFV